MEGEGGDNKTMKSMMGKELDKKLNRAKAKEKREKKLFGRRKKNNRRGRQKLVRVAQETQTTMEKKNGPHQKMEAVFLQRERALREKKPSRDYHH